MIPTSFNTTYFREDARSLLDSWRREYEGDTWRRLMDRLIAIDREIEIERRLENIEIKENL